MNYLQSLIIGIVEGLTEYLPVSSTGHIILAQRAMGIQKSPEADAFAVVVQAGAIVAVLGLYWQRVKQMCLGLAGKDRDGLNLARNLILAFLPAAVAGLLFGKEIKRLLFGLWPITIAWWVGGAAILIISWWAQKRRESGGGNLVCRSNPLESLTMQQAIIIGCIQCVALCPGTSRSLMVLAGGLSVGLSLAAAVEFSFLLGLITLTAASAKDIKDDGALLMAKYGIDSILIGFAGAWISAVLAIKWMVGYLKRRPLAIFGYYRIALAVVVALLIFSGKLQNS
jgi:undecaprenyl-diphosphatase